MLFFLSAKYYAYLFIIEILLLPGFIFFPLLVFPQTQVLYWVLMATNMSLMIFTWRYNSGPRLSFIKGLESISRTHMSGCANLTMLYLFPVLFMAYCIGVYNAIIGLRKGRSFTQQKWLQTVSEYEIMRLHW